MGRGPTNDDEGFFVSAISNVFGRGCGAGRGPNNDDEEFFVSADFKCFRKGAWGREGGPLISFCCFQMF